SPRPNGDQEPAGGLPGRLVLERRGPEGGVQLPARRREPGEAHQVHDQPLPPSVGRALRLRRGLQVKTPQGSGFVLPLPGWVMHRYTAVVIAAVHVYLSFGHLSPLFGGDVQWTHFWKGFGSLGGAYVFAALATRGFARHRTQFHQGVAPVG